MERFEKDLEETFDYDEFLEKDENEQRYDKAVKHRKNVKLKRKASIVIFNIAIIVLLLFYLMTDLSSVKVVQVNDNNIYSKTDIMKIAGINYNSKSILHPSFLIEYKLKHNDLISNAKVSKSFDGGIYIDLNEEKIIGYYYKGKKPYVLLENGSEIEMNSSNINLIISPYLDGLNETQLKKLRNSLKSLEFDNISLISEIRPYKTSYDNDMLELIMVDGHKVRVSYDGLSLLKSYKEILKGLNSSLQCIELVEETNSAYSQNCE